MWQKEKVKEEEKKDVATRKGKAGGREGRRMFVRAWANPSLRM